MTANSKETPRKRGRGKPFTKGDKRINLSGRPKNDAEFIAACRERTPKALATLDRAMEDVENNPGPAVKAAEILLHRGWGSAPAVVRLEGEATVQVQHTARVELGPERLQRVAMLLERVGALEALRGEVRKLEAGGEVVDVKPESEEEAT